MFEEFKNLEAQVSLGFPGFWLTVFDKRSKQFLCASMIIFIANCSAISNTYSMEIQMARVTKYKHALQLPYHQNQPRTVNNDYTMYILR